MTKETFRLVYTKVEADQCAGVELNCGDTVCRGWVLEKGKREPDQLICDMAKCPLLSEVALGEGFNDSLPAS